MPQPQPQQSVHADQAEPQRIGTAAPPAATPVELVTYALAHLEAAAEALIAARSIEHDLDWLLQSAQIHLMIESERCRLWQAEHTRLRSV